MILAAVMLAPILLGAIVFYVESRPRIPASGKAVWQPFDTVVMVLIVLSCHAAAFYFRMTTGEGADRAWWPILSAGACLVLTSVILVGAALVRRAARPGSRARDPGLPHGS